VAHWLALNVWSLKVAPLQVYATPERAHHAGEPSKVAVHHLQVIQSPCLEVAPWLAYDHEISGAAPLRGHGN